MPSFKTVDAAGGLTIDDHDRILFIFKDGRWDLPKGLVERKTEPEETARKEVSEETGLPLASLSVITELIPTAHVSKAERSPTLKTTRWFLIRHAGKSETFRPQTKEGIVHCAWIPLWDLDKPLANCPSRIRYLIHFWTKARKGFYSAKD